jgi:uncharacterized protein
MKNTVGYERINSKKIFYSLKKPRIKKKIIVIMSHGFRGSSLGPARTFVDFETLLIKNGYAVLRFDQPNCGNSEGKYINVSFKEWVKTTVYFANKYVEKNYRVILLGQSMGATVSVIASNNIQLRDKIQCLLLWVPDPKLKFAGKSDVIAEEAGQKYQQKFWIEAKQLNFFKCLEDYTGAIHLVYGENDRYVSKEMRQKVIKEVRKKRQPIMILKGQDHSPWNFDIAQEVYREELRFLKV